MLDQEKKTNDFLEDIRQFKEIQFDPYHVGEQADIINQLLRRPEIEDPETGEKSVPEYTVGQISDLFLAMKVVQVNCSTFR